MNAPPVHLLEPHPWPALFSLVFPVFNEEEVLPLLLERLRKICADLPCPVEMVFVNDGSSDGSLALLAQAAVEDNRIKVVSLARNFGHQIAATAGLEYAQGDAVVLMDADLQDPPELLTEMLEAYRKGYDVVYARRISREGETPFKRITAWLFYRLMRRFVHRELPVDVGDFRLMSRPCLDALNAMRETHRFLRGMVAWIGYPQTEIAFVRASRAAGQTKYSLAKMLQFAWNAALSFSPLPLRMVFTMGLALAIGSFLYGVFAILGSIFGLYVVKGWTSSIAVTCFIGGGVLSSLGLLGEYIARIFEQVKGRPLYCVARTWNLKKEPTRRDG